LGQSVQGFDCFISPKWQHSNTHKLHTEIHKRSTQLNSSQLKFIKTGSSKAEHTHNNLYRYSKIYVNIKYSK